jgi:hypothetical protein
MASLRRVQPRRAVDGSDRRLEGGWDVVGPRLGFGRIVVSELKAPNILANLV